MTVRNMREVVDLSQTILKFAIHCPFKQRVTIYPKMSPVKLRRELWWGKAHPKAVR